MNRKKGSGIFASFDVYEIALFNVFEVFDRVGFQLFGCFVVANDDGMLVHLQNADGPHVVDAAFNGMVQCSGLVGTGCQNHYFVRVADGADADGKRRAGNLIDVIVKKARIGLYCFGGGF